MSVKLVTRCLFNAIHIMYQYISHTIHIMEKGLLPVGDGHGQQKDHKYHVIFMYVNLCMCVYMYIYTYIYIYTHIYIYIILYLYLYLYLNLSIISDLCGCSQDRGAGAAPFRRGPGRPGGVESGGGGCRVAGGGVGGQRCGRRKWEIWRCAENGTMGEIRKSSHDFLQMP